MFQALACSQLRQARLVRNAMMTRKYGSNAGINRRHVVAAAAAAALAVAAVVAVAIVASTVVDGVVVVVVVVVVLVVVVVVVAVVVVLKVAVVVYGANISNTTRTANMNKMEDLLAVAASVRVHGIDIQPC